MKKHHPLMILVIFTILISTSCATNKSIINSGKVTPKGNFAFGYNVMANIPTASIEALKDQSIWDVPTLVDQPKIYMDDLLKTLNKAVIAYSLDPVASNFDYFLRYGLFKRVDIGYKHGPSHIFDVQYQFMGPIGNINSETDDRWYGSIGMQYSSISKYEMPSFLEPLAERFDYGFKRKDFLWPLIFSYSLGAEEKYGAVSFGPVLGLSLIDYNTFPTNIFNPDEVPLPGLSGSSTYFSYGGFVNLKLGYKRVYLVPSISLFRQDYGTYQLINAEKISIDGWSFVYSIGLRFRLGRNSPKK